MSTPKTPEPRPAASRAKPPAASTSDSPVATDGGHQPPPGGRDVVVEQLVELTRSIGDLVRQNAAGTGSATAAAAADDPAQRARVVFAYDFLGVVLGRRAPSVFQLTLVGVTRESGRLTFTGLKGATAARVRSARNQVRLLEGLADGQPVRIDQAPNAIDDAARIDSIVTFTVAGGVPVALGPCLDPVDGIVTG